MKAMKLKDYIQAAPKQQRQALLQSLANAHARPLSTIYKWQYRDNHPATDEAMAITERWSGYKVTRFDERPDVYSLEGFKKVLGQSGFKIEKHK